MRILAALSGGVDSSVAAARLVDAGHEVVGIHLALSPQTINPVPGSRGCCSPTDAADAEHVAQKLGIRFEIWDFSDQFQERVVDYFVDTYQHGETPNPCLRCNATIKFEALLEKGLSLGYDAVATGHYAQLDNGQLRRAVDPLKDQSYVLGILTQHQLDHSIFPCGDTHKADIRKEAEERGFSVAHKPDSTDICFIPDGDTRQFLQLRIGTRKGPVVDLESREVVAQHNGTYGFTIGQRKGLGVGGPGPDGKPRYVVRIDESTNTVFIGPREMLQISYMEAWPPNWLDPDIVAATEAGETLELRCEVQVRAHARPIPCTIQASADKVTIHTDEPIYGVACGQTAMLYRPDPAGDIVIGSAVIHHTAVSPED
ncbi:MAG: tRNA 2-thiouridine(34) synthase MnmA [Lawsonella sp.]